MSRPDICPSFGAMMRLVFLAICVVLLGCGKNDTTEPQPVHSTPDGNWTYTTPDKSISVDFTLQTTGTTLEIINVFIKVSSNPGDAAGQISGVSLPTIDQIRINANDIVLVKPYSITFVNCTMSSNFNFISVADAEYTYPWGSIKTLQNITIARK